MMKNFSHRHKLHLSLAGLYALALLRILHVIRYSMLFSFSFQMCLLSSVLDFFFSFLNDALWFAYRVLNELAVRPT